MALLLTLGLVLPAAAAPLKVMTFNIYNRPWRRDTRMQRTVQVLAQVQPDIVGLQEVSMLLWWRRDPSVQLARALGMQRARFWLEDGAIITSGVAILSRFPLTGLGVHRFSDNRFWDEKGFTFAVADTPLGQLGVIDVHMSPLKGGPVKEVQFAELLGFCQAFARRFDVVLLGDFNEEHTTPLFRRFITQLRAQDLFAVHPPPPGLRTWAGGYGASCADPDSELLDYVLIIPQQGRPPTAPLRILAGGVLQPAKPYPSDHCPVWALVDRVGGASPSGDPE